ncbi:MAG: hypothetical protein REI45_01945 [Propionicimonas sp.]|nr:hypothetical protein [Propionicimonas sp.]
MPVTVYLDESGTHASSRRMMVGAVVTLDADDLELAVKQRREAVAADSSLWPDPSKRPVFRDDGFHHHDDDETIRDRFIETMQTLGFRAHVCYTHRALPGIGDTELLLVMYHALVRNLLRRYAGETVDFVFETKSEMDPLYGGLVMHALESLDLTRAPRATATARIGDKPLGGLSVVDYVLALTEAHLQREEGGDVNAFRLARFARIGPQIAHLIDFDNAVHKRRLARIL